MSRMLMILPCRFQNATESGISVSFIQNPYDTGLSHTNAMHESRPSCLRCISPVKSALGVSAISTLMATGPDRDCTVSVPVGRGREPSEQALDPSATRSRTTPTTRAGAFEAGHPDMLQ